MARKPYIHPSRRTSILLTWDLAHKYSSYLRPSPALHPTFGPQNVSVTKTTSLYEDPTFGPHNMSVTKTASLRIQHLTPNVSVIGIFYILMLRYMTLIMSVHYHQTLSATNM